MDDTEPRAADDRASDGFASYLEDAAGDIVDRLSAWVMIPSVSADPDSRMDMTRSAHWIAGEMRDAGLETTLLPTGDSFAVFGERLVDPEAPTILVYSHHDVRHAKPEEWSETEPFTAVLRDGRLYGRGASDAKGQVLAHVWGLRAFDACGELPLNVKLLIDGEEEIGSPNLEALLREHRDRLGCDAIVFSDTIQWRDDAPAPVTSMRGTLTATLTVMGPERDVHSGVASGVTLNPSLVLARILAGMHDDSDRIAIPGFYDRVAPVSADRRRELGELPFDEDVWLERTETRAVTGEAGYTVPERLWVRPAIEVISLLAGDPTGIERSVIPREATASLSIRTVPDQSNHDVADRLREYVAAAMPTGAAYELTVDERIAQEPYTAPRGAMLDALELALARGYGTEVRGRMGNAGGGPAELLSRELDAPVSFLGTGLPEDHWHASDESVDVRMLLQGAATIAHLWQEIARRGRSALRE